MSNHDFSLLGGPFHRALIRIGLAGRDGSTATTGLAIGFAMWVVLVVVAYADGVAGQLFSLSKLSGHVRLLVVIPLFFYAEWLVNPRQAGFITMLVRTGVIDDQTRPAFEAILQRVVRIKDSWVPDALCLVAAVTVALTARHLPLVGATAGGDPSRYSGATTWCWMACLTVFRFLMARWIVRLALWAYTLWRIARLDLHLVATHPDGAAGLGNLHQVQLHFVPLVLAISTLQSASLAEELSAGSMVLGDVVPVVVLVAVLDAVLFGGPPLFFFPQLWRTRVAGLRMYMTLGSDYVRGFERKWVHGDRPPDEPLLGTGDLQSLADLTNSLSVVRNLRMVPIVSQKLLVSLGSAAALPLLPLLLFEYPIVDLAARFLRRLTGL
jgi:hypothetical protein